MNQVRDLASLTGLRLGRIIVDMILCPLNRIDEVLEWGVVQ